MNVGFELSLGQKQILSPQQLESLEILAMNSQELCDLIASERDENPLLVFVDEREPLRTVSYSEEDNDALLSIPAPEQTTPADILLQQIDLTRRTPHEEDVLRFVAEAVDANGFLTVSADEAAHISGFCLRDVQKAIDELQKLEPPGVAASSLAECLLLQLRRLGREDEVFRKMISEHLEDIAYGTASGIAKALKISPDEARRRLSDIRALNPKPLNGYCENAWERPSYIVPDIIITYDGHTWTAELNDNWYGNLAVSDYYARMALKTADEELREYLKNKMLRVRFLNAAIEKRRNTLVMIAERVASYQRAFLLERKSLVPLTMSRLSEDIGIHLSTLSRAIRRKYIQYPSGVCEMRSLFSQPLPAKNSDDATMNRNDAKSIIKHIIDTEDVSRPFSDSRLVSILQREGIKVSRRTIAKYRGEMGIRGTSDRRCAASEL
jgi:RNA polymerase sigma-54 factor